MKTDKGFQALTKKTFWRGPEPILLSPQSTYSSVSLESLRPSRISTALKIFSALFKPALLLALITGFFVSVQAFPLPPSLFSADKANPDGFVENEVGTGKLALLTKAGSNEFASGGEDLARQQSKISFIAGLIAVHRPSLKNSGEVARHIVQRSALAGVDPFYVAAIISVESRFGTKARSRAGALGLMQLLPNTAKDLSKRATGKKSYPQLSDPETNIHLGVKYIKELEAQYGGNRYIALAAYNWGPGNVAKVQRNKARFPKSVQKYASTILERYLRWKTHYQRAEKSATAIS